MAQEVELKFDIGPDGGDTIRRAALFGASPARTKRQDSIYYDTADGALRRAGFSLRVRRSGGCYVQTVKHDSGGDAGMFVRGEWESEVPDFAPDTSVLDMPHLPHGLGAGDSTLAPIVRTRVSRTIWQVRHRDSWIEVALDEGTVTGGAAGAPIRELELELLNGAPESIFHLAEEIGAATPLRLGVLSKVERGYALAEGKLARPARADPVHLTLPTSADDAFHAIAQACLRHFRLNEVVLLDTHDAEALHQARVAIRRLRSALSLFRPAVKDGEQQHFNQELRWLGRQLSDARNLDVLIGRADEDADLREALQRLRAEAYAHVEATLRSERARHAMLKFVAWLALGAWRERRKAGRDVAALGEKRLDRQWHRIVQGSADLATLDPEGRHRLRIRIKKLRYATEFLSSLYATKPLARRRDDFLDALKQLQEQLGDLNDAWTAQTLAAALPEALRLSILSLHSPSDHHHALQSAEKAVRRANEAAGFWRFAD